VSGICSADTKKTDAQADALAGPVRSVSTRQQLEKIELPSPTKEYWAPATLPEISEYDREGNRVRSGSYKEGTFEGEVVRIVRDENGKISEKLFEDAKGGLYRHEFWGPFGIVEKTDILNEKALSHATWIYDAYGRVSEFHFYDQDGIQIQNCLAVNGAAEHNREEWDYGKGGVFQLHYIETYEPKTDFWTFTNLNEDGSIKVAVETARISLISYRQNTDEPYVMGSIFFMDPENKKLATYQCHADSTCDATTSDCLDETCYLVSRSEQRDSKGNLELLMEREFELDRFGNWTKRITRISGPGLQQRTLAETDYRELRYWPR
jgi:hypothetical protein